MDIALQLGLMVLAVTAVGIVLPLIGLTVAALAPRTPGWRVVRLLLAVLLAVCGAGLLALVALVLTPPANASLSVLVVGGPLGLFNLWAGWRCLVTQEPDPRPDAQPNAGKAVP